MLRLLASTLAALALLSACATPPALSPATLTPNPNLHLQGLPPIPASLADEVARYNDFRGHGFVAWHPTLREMLVSHRKAGGSTTQLWRLKAPLAPPEPVTQLPEPISNASYEPRDGRYIVYARSSGGDEAYQLWRLDLDSGRHERLTDPAQRHSAQGWLHGPAQRTSRLIVASVPLDRTAQGGTRERIETQLSVLDPLAPQGRDVIATLPGAGWHVADVAPDEKTLALGRYISATRSEVWLFDLATRQRTKLLPRPDAPPSSWLGSTFRRDGAGLLVGSDAAGEFREAVAVGLDGTVQKRVTAHIPWDVSSLDASRDGRLLALQANEDGSDVLRLFDARTLAERPRPALPEGNIGRSAFHPSRPELAFSVANAQSPGQVYTLDTETGRVEPWTRAESSGADTSTFVPQRLVRWKSFDGRTISGWLSMPPARHTGRRPVLINIHGGPEAQAQSGFLGRWQYAIQELGVAMIQPNVRGSSGYGKTFLDLDNGRLREDSVKDIGALLDWIAQQPDLDPNRVVVMGGSYGGYMSLASAANYADRLAGAIDVVGISHFVTFLESTESYRRDLRRVEYGDERDPQMRDFLHRISPLTNAHRITRPLLVAQGRNDPRVPYTEAEQIVAKARANGTAVWYVRAENEGHGFARKENADYFFYAALMFLRQTMRL